MAYQYRTKNKGRIRSDRQEVFILNAGIQEKSFNVGVGGTIRGRYKHPFEMVMEVRRAEIKNAEIELLNFNMNSFAGISTSLYT